MVMTQNTPNYRVALLSSGLGHVNRGVETWTADLGRYLHEGGVDVTVYKGSGQKERDYEVVIPCLERESAVSKWIIKHRPGVLWRLGFGSGYTLEELTFSFNILPELAVKNYEIIHTQDPQVADFLRKMVKFGVLNSKIILAHGTEESFDLLKKFEYVQHLAPLHYQEAVECCGEQPNWYMIPNAVDTKRFNPTICTDKRKELGIPEDAFVVISVAAIKKTHKRMDHLIEEVAALQDKGLDNVYLLLVGAKTEETESIMQLGQKLLGGKIKCLADQPHEMMPQLYAMADLFVLCSLKEMLGIVFLEALSSGLPCLGHCYPVFQWVIGPGGECIDMEKSGELTKTIGMYAIEKNSSFRMNKAREHAINYFSKEVVLEQTLAMYEEILNSRRPFNVKFSRISDHDLKIKSL